jgi:hypothetical protein
VNAITGRYAGFAQIINGDAVDKYVSIENVYLNGKWIDYLHQYLQEIFFKNKYDGCYERPEYYLLKRYKSGAAFNCFLVKHMESEREIYASDDPHAQYKTAIVRKWMKDKNYKFPALMLSSQHIFYAPQIGRVYIYTEIINPETHGAPKNKFTTEEQSEYHRANIDQYPKKKKFMESFISQQAYMHQKFEEMVGAKPRHKLDLVQYINEKDIKAEAIKETKTTISSASITDELTKLNKLYKEGAITKEEFDKAKKKVLNQ